MLYRELKSYKFELAQTYQIQTEIFPEKQIIESYVGLGVDGLLTIFKIRITHNRKRRKWKNF